MLQVVYSQMKTSILSLKFDVTVSDGDKKSQNVEQTRSYFRLILLDF